MRLLVPLCLMGTLWMVAGCASSAGPGHKLTWRTLSRGVTSGIEDSRRLAIRTEADYLRLWAEHAVATDRQALPPEVNFEREMAIFVGLGTRPTGGYLIEVVDVELRGRTMRVLVGETQPQPGAFQIQQLTQPYQLIALPAVSAKVDFREVRRTPETSQRRARPGEEGSGRPLPSRPRAPTQSPRGAAGS